MTADGDAPWAEKLDPSLPANRKTIAWLENAWANEQLMSRLNWRGHGVVAVIVAVCLHPLSALLEAAGLESVWLRVPVCVFVMFAAMGGLLRLLRRGWFNWLVHHDPA